MRTALPLAAALLLGPALQASPFVLVTGDDRGAEAVGAHSWCGGSWTHTVVEVLERRFRSNDGTNLLDAHAQEGEAATSLDGAVEQAREAAAPYALWAVVKPDPSALHDAAWCKKETQMCGYGADLTLLEVPSKKVLMHIRATGNAESVCHQIGRFGDASSPAVPLYELLQRAHKLQTTAAKNELEARRRAALAQAEQKRKAEEESELAVVRYQPGQRLAVLEFESALADPGLFDRLALTEQVRSIPATRAPGMLVMTRESEEQLLQASGKAPGDCTGECEVETGRKLGADYIVSGRLYQSGPNVRAMLKLFRTSDGALLSTASATGRDQETMENSIELAATKLFAVLQRQ